MDYTKAMQEMSSSDILVIVDVRQHALGTKIYDYIYLNKPIIYLGPKHTDLSNFVLTFQNGYVCSNKQEVIDATNDIINQHKRDLANKEDVEKYSRSIQNKKYLNILELIRREKKCQNYNVRKDVE